MTLTANMIVQHIKDNPGVMIKVIDGQFGEGLDYWIGKIDESIFHSKDEWKQDRGVNGKLSGTWRFWLNTDDDKPYYFEDVACYYDEDWNEIVFSID